MGCSIHIFGEVRDKKTGNWKRIESDTKSFPFDWRSYGMYGFLADVRNYSRCVPVSLPKGLPYDSEYLNDSVNDGWFGSIPRREEIDHDGDYHSFSHLTVRELIDFDYERTFVNQRENSLYFNKEMTHREHLGEEFFAHLEELKSLGNPDDVRIVFWFDN